MKILLESVYCCRFKTTICKNAFTGRAKFQGLAKQFGIGCDTILLDDHQLHSRLFDSIIKAREHIKKYWNWLIPELKLGSDAGLNGE